MHISAVSPMTYRGNQHQTQPAQQATPSPAYQYSTQVGKNVMHSVAIFGGINLLSQLLIRNSKSDGIWSFWANQKALTEIKTKGFSKSYLKQDLMWGVITGVVIGSINYFSSRKKNNA
jgi:hypothetical protein